MIYTLKTKQALMLCFEAHKNQTDKSGLPYVFHPFHVAEQMSDEDTTIVALLHDVVEDTDYTLDDLRSMGFNDGVISALSLLTHDESVPYLQYVGEIRKNPIARAVKQADLIHNSDLSRLDHITKRDKARVLKYKMAIAILGEHRREYDGTFRFAIPLDEKRLFFLSVFYTKAGIERYSLDAEYADDVHYSFSEKDSARILKLLPNASSLPEALSEYLIDHNEEDFAVLLRNNDILLSGFHFNS